MEKLHNVNSAVCTIVSTNNADRASRRNESGASIATRNKKTTRLEKVQSALEDIFLFLTVERLHGKRVVKRVPRQHMKTQVY